MLGAGVAHLVPAFQVRVRKERGYDVVLVLFLQVHDPALATPVHMNVGKDGDFGVLPSDGRLCITLRAGILYTSHVHRPAPRLPRCAPTALKPPWLKHEQEKAS